MGCSDYLCTNCHDEQNINDGDNSCSENACKRMLMKRQYSSIDSAFSLDLGSYSRRDVTNAGPGQDHFDQGLRLLLSYQHEEATQYLLSSLESAPDCALAHALVALCHSPNYNFKGEAYYETSYPRRTSVKTNNTTLDDSTDKSSSDCASIPESIDSDDSHEFEFSTAYPNQLLADYHSRMAVEKVLELKKLHSRKKVNHNGHNFPRNNVGMDGPKEIKEVEVMLINAIRCLNCNPGTNTSLAEKINGYPYSNAMRKVCQQYPKDAEVAYFFAESIMVLHAWNLFEYPSGKPLADTVEEVKDVLDDALKLHPQHVGLCHMYVHLCEMATYPEKALPACEQLRTRFPDAGHLLHMPTHIDVLLGDYEACVKWNDAALEADMKTMERSPETSCVSSFYFGYICHNYHMLIYGAILGAMEAKATSVAKELNNYIHEAVFVDKPELAVYLESYGTMDIHVLVRFGRWKQILELELPKNSKLMLYRAASIYYAKAIAYANLGNINAAKQDACEYEKLRALPDGKKRLLHNNTIADLLDIDSFMIQGEIAFFEGYTETAYEKLRHAIQLQDNLNYDEPWGKMQPIRHALGGLLLKKGFVKEAEKVYREDLARLPKNPWSLKGLMRCLSIRTKSESDSASLRDTQVSSAKSCCSTKITALPSSVEKLSECEMKALKDELQRIKLQFIEQRNSQWADYNVTHSCACCIDA